MGLAVRNNGTQVKQTICLKMGKGDGAAVGGQNRYLQEYLHDSRVTTGAAALDSLLHAAILLPNSWPESCVDS